MSEHGIDLESVKKDRNMKDIDDFDFICYLAFDQKIITREERANNVKKGDFLSQYHGVARKVLDSLLDKYINAGIYQIETIEILKLEPFCKYGKPSKIASYFGGRNGYLRTMKALEEQIYYIE